MAHDSIGLERELLTEKIGEGQVAEDIRDVNISAKETGFHPQVTEIF